MTRKKETRSAKVDVALLARVKKFLGASTDSDAIAKALEAVEEQRLFIELIDSHGGKVRTQDFGG